ncbi:MAG: fatty acid desaturase family protein [Bacteroidota bacterium]
MQAHPSPDLHSSLNPTIFKPLFRPQPYRHALAMLVDWLIISLTIGLSIFLLPAIFYPLAVLIIGARMHALAILMHDATHFRFLKNRYWNDLLTNIFTMYPLFTSIETYRQNHLRHHQHLNTEDDPDWVAKLGKRAFTFPKTKSEFLLTIGSYLVMYKGISDAIWFLRRFQAPAATSAQHTENTAAKLVFYLVLFVSLSLSGTWLYFLLFWVVPYLSTFFMYQYVRSVAEHYGELAHDHALTSSRTVKPNLLERFFLAPHQVGYHLEHHLYPGVPFYNLPKLHDVLMTLPAYRQKAHITQGYFSGLLQELGEFEQRSAKDTVVV